MINYTPFNERITSDRWKFVHFAQVFIMLYSVTLPAMRKPRSFSRWTEYNHLKTLLKSILKWFPSYCKKKWINAQFTRGAVIQTFLFFTSSKIASILSSTKYWEKKTYSLNQSAQNGGSIDARTFFADRWRQFSQGHRKFYRFCNGNSAYGKVIETTELHTTK